VADGNFQVVDITVPDSPAIVGAVTTPGWAIGVTVAGNYAYVADGSSGLQVIDISVPQSPEIIGAVDTPYDAKRVAVDGNYAYVVDGWPAEYGLYGLQVIDISEPTFPVMVGAFDTPGQAFGVAVAGNYAYVAGSWSGLLVIDISVPETPALVGAVTTPGWAIGVAVAGNYAYVADGSSGLQIAWRQCDILTAINPGPDETPCAESGIGVYPNPFNPSTIVSFSLDRPHQVTISVYDMTGRRVALIANQQYGAGTHTATWNGKDNSGRSVSSGTYLVRMETADRIESQKISLIR
jgi:uncharacterized secreted protein with C-terminal beta-propeller domain